MPDKKSGSKPRGPGLSEDERALWQAVTRDAKPLKKPAKTTPAPPTPSEAPQEKPAKKAAPPRALAFKASVPKPRAKPHPSLGHGDIADLDKRSAERMRRGRMPIEATLDLHGHSQDQARQELAAFLARAQGAGKRCVVVVTGKGDIGRGGGILRAQVPQWLNDPENRPRVLAFDYAQRQHGGLGAIYVLLRKARR